MLKNNFACSLVKMVYAFTEKTKQKPTWYEMLHAIKRNFGGLEEEKVDPVGFFKERLSKIIAITKEVCLFVINIEANRLQICLIIMLVYKCFI